MGIKEIIIQKVKFGDVKTGETKGKKWTLHPVGIMIKDKWYNGSFFNAQDVEELRSIESGQTKLLVFFKESYKNKAGEIVSAWKFRLPKIEEENNFLLKKILTLLDK